LSDTNFSTYLHYGTAAERAAFTPSPAIGDQPIYAWYESDTDNFYIYTTVWKGPYASGSGFGTSVDLTAQTASITSTDILTPSADRLFEVSVLQLVSSAGSAGIAKVEIGWTDEQGAKTRVIATDLDLSDASGEESGVAVIRAKTSAAITYTVTVTGAAGSPEFDLHINVRAL
jgi:hypothetical protein